MILLPIILNPQIWLILEAGVDHHYKNLLTNNEVAVIIPDKHSNAGFRDIVLAKHSMPNKPLQYCRINSTYAAYIPLHYVLLFLYSDIG